MLKIVSPIAVACLIGLVATAILLQEIVPLHVVLLAFALLVLLSHGLSLFSRKTRRRYFGLLDGEWIGTVPNLTILLIGITYGLAGLLLREEPVLHQAMFAATGIVALVTIALCHLTGDALSRRSGAEHYSLPVPPAEMKAMAGVGRGIIVYLRRITVLSSAVLLLVVVWRGINLPALAALLLVLLAFTSVLVRMKMLAGEVHTKNLLANQKIGSAYFEALRPEFLIYYSDPAAPNTAALQKWLPHFRALQRPHLIMLRERKHFTNLVKAKVTNIVLAEGMTDIERFVLKSMKAVVTINNAAKNTQIVRFSHMKQINVVQTEKYVNSPLPASFVMYSHLLFSSYAVADKASEMADLHSSYNVYEKGGASTLPEFVIDPNGMLAVGYLLAPVAGDWSRIARISKEIIHRLQNRAQPTTLLIRANAPHKSHSNPGSTFAEIVTASQQTKGLGNRATFYPAAKLSQAALINQADVLICDISAINSDLLLCNKPIIATDVGGLLRTDERPAFVDACYILRSDLSNIETILSDVVAGDSLRVRREAFIADIKARRGQGRFSEVLSRILEETERPALPSEPTPAA